MVGGVYKIEGKNNEFYVGSCINFVIRRDRHNSSYKNPNSDEYETKKYIHFRENDIIIKLIPLEVCDPNLTSEELKIREQHYIDLLKPQLNTQNAFQTKAQRREKKRLSNKEWRKNNPEKVRENKKRDYEKNKTSYKTRNAIYRKNHTEEIKIQKKGAYEKNKEHISKPVICECGCMINKSSYSRHIKSEKHRILTCKDALNDIISQIELIHATELGVL
jgi:hypothetical protein